MTSQAKLILCIAVVLPALAGAQMSRGMQDPRVGLSVGWHNAGEASRNMTLLAHRDKPEGWFDPAHMGSFDYADADLAFKGGLMFQGGWHGFQVWDISNPANPKIRTTYACFGGQGDPSVYRNLLFISVEDARGRVDCSAAGVQDSVSAERFRGVRIFDISDLDHPKQVAAVQTRRCPHTHPTLPHPKAPANAYVHVQRTSILPSPTE